MLMSMTANALLHFIMHDSYQNETLHTRHRCHERRAFDRSGAANGPCLFRQALTWPRHKSSKLLSLNKPGQKNSKS